MSKIIKTAEQKKKDQYEGLRDYQINILESMKVIKTCDIIISLNRPSRLKIFWKRILSFFGIKDKNIVKMFINKNRRGS